MNRYDEILDRIHAKKAQQVLQPRVYPPQHSPTCNSGLAKYPNGIPAGIKADRNCDCGVESRESQLRRGVPPNTIPAYSRSEQEVGLTVLGDADSHFFPKRK